MSGHSKWSTIKRQKAIVDAKRGAVFTKFANLISLAAKEGDDPAMNPALKSAIEQAKEANLPKANIIKAIKRGTGEIAGDQIEEIYYEGIGPGGSQFMLKCLSDNKNRSVANIRHLFTKFGGSLASVAWNFNLAGLLVFSSKEISKNRINLEALELSLIDQGITDFIKKADMIVVLSQIKDLSTISQFLKDKGIKLQSAQAGYVAKEKQVISRADQEKVNKFITELESSEEVSDYYHNIA